MRLSRGFICALIGLSITLLAWFGPWAWPAWPAFAVLHVTFPRGGFGGLSFAARSAVVVMLMIINVAFWGLLSWALIRASSFRRSMTAR